MRVLPFDIIKSIMTILTVINQHYSEFRLRSKLETKIMIIASGKAE